MRTSRIILLLFCSGIICACDTDILQPAVLVDTDNPALNIYYPPTDSIALRCFIRPEPQKDLDIVFCCAAAFTLDFKKDADHKRICSSHVSEGIYYRKTEGQQRYTGAFVSYNHKWSFFYQKDADPAAFDTAFQNAAMYYGTGFSQEMMIHKGKKVPTTRPLNNVNLFRALCEIDGRLCVVDARESKAFGNFIDDLLGAGVQEAIYMDMGNGWNYSWYRENIGETAVFIHQDYQEAATNWLVFYKGK